MKSETLLFSSILFFSSLLLAFAKRFGGARWRPAPARMHLSGWRLLWILIMLAGGGAGVRCQTPGEWTWMHGDSVLNSTGVFGTQGIANPANQPPAVYESCEWKDNNGNFWLFGGLTKTDNEYTALWKFDPDPASPTYNQWTWMKGPSTLNQNGVYGTQGVPSALNYPGSRAYGATTWVDASGKFWLFGGSGFGASGIRGRLNDLWKYDPDPTSPTYDQWTWMKGPDVTQDPGSYGIQGVASPSNLPPARDETSCSWTDNAGNLWFYGGMASTGTYGDLWRYTIATNEWTWMKGTTTFTAPAIYGIQGVASPANMPGKKRPYCSWKDLSGNLWFFGGMGVGASSGNSNDLWKYNPDPASPTYNQWTWMKGSASPNDKGSYGIRCISANTNLPPSRWENRARVRDTCGNFWNYGGGGYGDLWHYKVSTNQWTWVSGDNTLNQPAVYGAKGVSSPANKPGGRQGNVAWIDNKGYMWFFGGMRIGINASNDLFRYVPAALRVFSDTTICPGQSVTLSAVSCGNSYVWSAGGQTTSSIVVSPSVSTTYTVTGNGFCGSTSASVSVTVLPLPSITVTASNTTICIGPSVTISASGGTSYLWSSGGQTTSAIVVSPTTSTTYNVTGSNVCGSDTDSVAVTVASNITALAPGTTVCAGQNATLIASGGNNYLWSNGQTTASIVFTPTSTSTYSVIVSSGNCSDTAYTSVTLLSPITANQATSICPGMTHTLPGGTVVGVSGIYKDTLTSANGCDSIITTILTVKPVSTYSQSKSFCPGQTYTLPGGTVVNTGGVYNDTLTSANGCDSIITTTLTIHPIPPVTISPNVTISQGASTVLTASGGGNYQWSSGEATSSISVFPIQTTTYCVTVTDANGCTNISCVIVTIEDPCSAAITEDELSLPNAFSPNNDGENDEFCLPVGQGGRVSCIQELEIVIYDRWGEKVFQSDDPKFCWNGEYRQAIMNTAVFVYYVDVILISGEKIKNKGNVSLMR